ncbi:MAG: TonB family protein [Nitrospirota bacterium]|nr:TonB family protein [Nitrospirota bacterium]
MRLLTGKRIGQSGSELTAAVFFSFFIHIIFFFGAFFLTQQIRQRVVVPPFYRVNLVDLPADTSLPPSAQPQTAPVEPAAAPKKPAPRVSRTKPGASKAKTGPAKAAPAPKSAMPDLETGKRKEAADDKPAAAPEGTGKRQEAVSVAVASGGQAFPFPPYVAILRDKVERNWTPPPGVKGAKVTVLFSVLRSGRVGDAKLMTSSGNFYFDQAAMRAILSSSPFPPLPEGFFKEQETFSVDLMEQE